MAGNKGAVVGKAKHEEQKFNAAMQDQYRSLMAAFKSSMPQVALQKAAVFTFAIAQILKGVPKPVSSWAEL